jgi:hypothetical protein
MRSAIFVCRSTSFRTVCDPSYGAGHRPAERSVQIPQSGRQSDVHLHLLHRVRAYSYAQC